METEEADEEDRRRLRHGPPAGRLFIPALGLAAPWLACVWALVPLGWIALPGAAALSLAAIPLAYWGLRPHLHAAFLLKRHVDALTADPEAAPPPPTRLRGAAMLLRELSSSLVGLRRVFLTQRDEQKRLLASADAVLDSVPDVLLTLNHQGQVVRANSAARRLFGRDAAGHDLSRTIRNPTALATAHAVIQGEPYRQTEIMLTDPTERHFVVAARALRARGPDGVAAVLALHDVTALRMAERQRGDFVANASHELRTPLATLVGFIETLRGPARNDEEARDRFLAVMQDQAQRMARLVEDLLSLSRIEQKQHQPPTGLVDLSDVMRRAAASFELHAARRRMTIQLQGVDAPAVVVGDADDLAQLAQNLIDNAIKYGRAESRVTVTVGRSGAIPPAMPQPPQGALAFTVEDQGEGVARDHLPRLTERFYRVDPGRSKAAGGTGLGLAIVKHIVARHRGALTIDSVLGKGSRFTVHLPAAPK